MKTSRAAGNWRFILDLGAGHDVVVIEPSANAAFDAWKRFIDEYEETKTRNRTSSVEALSDLPRLYRVSVRAKKPTLQEWSWAVSEWLPVDFVTGSAPVKVWRAASMVKS
jgi:hypothetical protein